MMQDGLCFDALKRGDPVHWRTAFAQFWPVALRAAHHPQASCLVPWEKEEVAHEAMLDWIDHFETLANMEEAKALLITISYRRAISAARRKYAAKRSAPPEVEEQFSASGSANLNGSCDVERADVTLLLKKVLDSVEPDTRLMLIDKIEGLTYKQISARYSIPIGTACTKVARGLEKMREQLRQTPMVMKELREHLR